MFTVCDLTVELSFAAKKLFLVVKASLFLVMLVFAWSYFWIILMFFIVLECIRSCCCMLWDDT